MLFTIIKKNSYQDSVNLMVLTKELSSMENLDRISVMMGTPANKDILKNSGLYTEKLEEAGPNDICIVLDSQNESLIEKVMEQVDLFFKSQSSTSKKDNISVSMSWDSALRKLPDANLALISIAGEYAAEEADKALDNGLNVFIFSDNVSIEDERKLKEKANGKGLLVMGPDCGTGIINGVPLAFANVINKGNIGIVGASGTGIQEISSLIDRMGGGVSHAIGIGGRDLSVEVGGISALRSIELLDNDDETKVIVFISKPPAKVVRDKVIEVLKAIDKPVVALFMGEKPMTDEENIHYVWTLEDAAQKALELSEVFNLDLKSLKDPQKGIKGLYSGGTLAAEAAMILEDRLGIPHRDNHSGGIMLDDGPHKIIDLGDDEFTKGKPHPMIDPTIRLDVLKEYCKAEDTATILLDFVIGYGGHDNVGQVFAPVIKEIKEDLNKKGKDIIFIGSVTGTNRDLQIYKDQVKLLQDAGVVIRSSNAKAVMLATDIIKYLKRPRKLREKEESLILNQELKVINIGLKHFCRPIKEHGDDVVHFRWQPIAGGNKYLASLISKLK